ncbi:Bug family tripartite tricarboxylate transporter substrate binding protein [Teichococcus vastitatis]|jgi:tripartite-type tricarboxylate transporter receptor subunit TctC|uniref:Tripartite tricarboxylate transporter substrate binding protein n=1 Tax=Teichococcus vastitatis TaxID=2307076 RepID=A0ABS9W457_9PROT|nr:tripartite tricarboxylate transporter substrate binding protein [Pseudoroseomonas vastitatis]MCI0753848.1 tripartite tricarboxylate transporter substrate binding protein [Pseudoroseomonas vastitatis]
MTQHTGRGLLRRLALVALAACAPLAARAAEPGFPAREIRFLNPFAPGGTSDLIGRILAEQLGKQIGQNVIVENRTGAGGVVATQELARSAPDGHTLLLASMGILTITPQMQSLPYDVQKDLVPVANIASVYNILVTGPRSEIRSWQDVARLGKERGRNLSCATVGAGSSQQLSCILFAALTGSQITQVPYRGGAPAILDISSGRVDVMFGNMPEFIGQIRDGGLRAVAYGAQAASPLMPELPVISKDGLPGFVIPSWFGVVVPGGTPQAIVDRWNAELNRALASPEVQRRFTENGLMRIGGTRDDFQRHIEADRARWGAIIREHNIRAE